MIARMNAPLHIHRVTALIVGAGMALTVGGALAFQHVGGYIPCKLCYAQRLPYYIGIGVMVLAALAATIRLPSTIARLLLLVGALLMVWSVWLGVHHAGIEWGWWAGPTDCGAVAAPAGGSGAGVLDQIDQFVPPSCDKAALRILGLSLAGWNAVISFVLAIVAFRGAASKA